MTKKEVLDIIRTIKDHYKMVYFANEIGVPLGDIRRALFEAEKVLMVNNTHIDDQHE